VSKPLKTTLSIVLIIVFLGSTVGFILTISAGGGDEPVEASLQVTLYPTEEIFTCAYKSYGDDMTDLYAAKTIIKNTGDTAVEDFRISYKIEGYCDWTSTEIYPQIVPGQTVRDYCFPNFAAEAMEEISTKTPVELTMKYEYDGIDQPVEDTEKIYLLGKNDFVFTSLEEEDILTFTDATDNYPILAAFVTPNEEVTKSAAHEMAGGLETGMNDEDVYQAFLRCFDYLRAAGVKYIQEPATYWTERFAQYVQYPHETITRKSGTCLDLAICVTAMMEAVGIKSYVVLIPGHAIPMIELPNSGDWYGIESTFIDQEYAVSHFPDWVSPEVTANECVSIAAPSINDNMAEGTIILVDLESEWAKGVIPSW
jgi:hypothetical protein